MTTRSQAKAQIPRDGSGVAADFTALDEALDTLARDLDTVRNLREQMKRDAQARKDDKRAQERRRKEREQQEQREREQREREQRQREEQRRQEEQQKKQASSRAMASTARHDYGIVYRPPTQSASSQSYAYTPYVAAPTRSMPQSVPKRCARLPFVCAFFFFF